MTTDRQSRLAQEFMLADMPARFVWATAGDPNDPDCELGAIPAGVVLRCGPDHTVVVPWVPVANFGAPHTVYPLESLVPLTVGLLVVCRVCGRRGRIEQGAWVPAERGPGG